MGGDRASNCSEKRVVRETRSRRSPLPWDADADDAGTKRQNAQTIPRFCILTVSRAALRLTKQNQAAGGGELGIILERDSPAVQESQM